jgi:hypothetical protein
VLRRRSFWAAELVAIYAALAGLRADDGRGLAWAALVIGPFAIALVFRALEAWPADRDPSLAHAVRAVVTGAAVSFAGATCGQALTRDTVVAVGAAIASVGGLHAAQRFPSEGGLLAPPHGAGPSWFSTFALIAAQTFALAFKIAPTWGIATPPALAAWGVAASSLFAGALLVSTTARALVLRRLELGIPERASAGLQLGAAIWLAAIGSVAFGVVSLGFAMPAAAIASATTTCLAAATRDATSVARWSRLGAAVVGAAVPPALIAGWLARLRPENAATFAMVGTAAAAAAGLAAPTLGKLFAPERTQRERATEAAAAATLYPDPVVAIERALLALRERGGQRLADVSLYRVDPPTITRVDRAGYVATEPAELPTSLAELANDEPFGVARTEALRAAEVRRPDVRPLASWLADRGIEAVVTVRDDTSVAGLLAIARTPGRGRVDLEEARALRHLADRMGAAIASGGALARSLARENEARATTLVANERTEELDRERKRTALHREAATQLLARPARAAAFGPASRSALERIERLAATSPVMTLLATAGTDAVAWAAAFHLASVRRAEPFVVVDGVSAAKEPLAFWREAATSPLDAAGTGTLVVVDAHVLPADVQSWLGASAARAGLVVAIPQTASALLARGSMHEILADALGDRAVAVPTLASRPEDLRALAQAHLARACARRGVETFALEPAALAELLEHGWPGDELELAALMTRAALSARGPLVTRADLAAIGFVAQPSRPHASSRPPPSRKRA